MNWKIRHARLVHFAGNQCLNALESYRPELRTDLDVAFRSGNLPVIQEALLEVRKALAVDHVGMLEPDRLALWDLRSLLGGLLEPKNQDRWESHTDDMWEMEENRMAQDVATLRLGRRCDSYGDEKVWRGILEELCTAEPTTGFPLDKLS